MPHVRSRAVAFFGSLGLVSCVSKLSCHTCFWPSFAPVARQHRHVPHVAHVGSRRPWRVSHVSRSTDGSHHRPTLVRVVRLTCSTCPALWLARARLTCSTWVERHAGGQPREPGSRAPRALLSGSRGAGSRAPRGRTADVEHVSLAHVLHVPRSLAHVEPAHVLHVVALGLGVYGFRIMLGISSSPELRVIHGNGFRIMLGISSGPEFRVIRGKGV